MAVPIRCGSGDGEGGGRQERRDTGEGRRGGFYQRVEKVVVLGHMALEPAQHMERGGSIRPTPGD